MHLWLERAIAQDVVEHGRQADDRHVMQRGALIAGRVPSEASLSREIGNTHALPCRQHVEVTQNHGCGISGFGDQRLDGLQLFDARGGVAGVTFALRPDERPIPIDNRGVFSFRE